MVTPPMRTRTCEREAALYWTRTARVAAVLAVPPRTVAMRVAVAGTWVMGARKRALLLLSRVIQPVAEGTLMALPAAETVLPAMLGVPLSCAPRTVEALVSRVVGVVP